MTAQGIRPEELENRGSYFLQWCNRRWARGGWGPQVSFQPIGCDMLVRHPNRSAEKVGEWAGKCPTSSSGVLEGSPISSIW